MLAGHKSSEVPGLCVHFFKHILLFIFPGLLVHIIPAQINMQVSIARMAKAGYTHPGCPGQLMGIDVYKRQIEPMPRYTLYLRP